MIRRQLGWAVRDRFPRREVVREVQGVRMVLPWSHRLPDYAAAAPEYGQNLVRLAARLARDTPLTVLDVGANVGDSALQILAATDARILCIEADPGYLHFLHLNVDADDRIAVEEALLVPVADEQATGVRAVKVGGTARFHASSGTETTLRTVSPGELRARHADLDRLRLVKSDTDGYDVALVPAIAGEWADRRPVLFFEYDHALSREAGHDPLEVWSALAEHGYDTVAVWDQGGRPLGLTDVTEIGGLTGDLERPLGRRSQHYWDVAVAHHADAAGIQALRDLVPGRLADAREG